MTEPLGSTRVLHVINGLGTGGAERLLVDLVPAQRRLGITANVAVIERDVSGNFSRRLEEACPGGLVRLPGLGRYDPRHALHVARAFDRYDIVHAHLFPAQYWAVLGRVATRGRGRLVVTEHCAWNRRAKRWWSRWMDRSVYRSYDAVCCVSEDVAQFIRDHARVGAGRVRTIGNGIDLEAFQRARPLPEGEISPRVREGDRVVLHVAGFRPQKDQPTLLRAMQWLPADVKVVFVGDGETRPACESLGRRLGVADRAIFLGVREDVAALLASCEVAVLSSHHEGMPLAALEAMAAARPFVASRTPGLRELVEGAGVLFDRGDAVALAACLSRILDDPHERGEIASRCARRAAEFDVRETARRYCDVYHSLAPAR